MHLSLAAINAAKLAAATKEAGKQGGARAVGAIAGDEEEMKNKVLGPLIGLGARLLVKEGVKQAVKQGVKLVAKEGAKGAVEGAAEEAVGHAVKAVVSDSFEDGFVELSHSYIG